MDTIKATHGIEKVFQYAPTCDFSNIIEGTHYTCNNGYLYNHDGEVKSQCPSCKGSGLKIHTSSQDMIYFPAPLTGAPETSLSNMIHVVHMPESVLQMMRNDIESIEDKIIRTVFNGNSVTKDEVAKTATEMAIDQKGVYAALNKLGNKVSDTFIWMVEILADVYKANNTSIYHGFSMELNLDTLNNMFAQRKLAVDSGASNDVISVIDYSIIKKQHMDNPTYLNAFSLWESFRPFKNLTESERNSIIFSLPDNNKYKVLYIYFANIKANILRANENFYDLNYEQQKALIDAEIQSIIDSMPMIEERVTFEDLQ